MAEAVDDLGEDIKEMVEASKILAPDNVDGIEDDPVKLAKIMEFQDIAASKRALAGQFTKREKQFQESLGGDIEKVKDAFTELEAAFNKFHEAHIKYSELAADIDKSQDFQAASERFNQLQDRLSAAKVELKCAMESKKDVSVNLSESIKELTELIRSKRESVDQFESAMACLEESLSDIDKEKVRDAFKAVMECYQSFLEKHKSVLQKAHLMADMATMSAAEEIKSGLEQRFQAIRAEVTEFISGKNVWKDVKDYSADRKISFDNRSRHSASSFRSDRTTDSVRAQRLRNDVEVTIAKTRVEAEESRKQLMLRKLQLRQQKEREDLELELQIREQDSQTALKEKLAAAKELEKQEAMLTGGVVKLPENKEKMPIMETPKIEKSVHGRVSKIPGVAEWGSKRLKCSACMAWIREGESDCHVCGVSLRGEGTSTKSVPRKVSFAEVERSRIDHTVYDRTHEQEVDSPSIAAGLPRPIATSTPRATSTLRAESVPGREKVTETYMDPVSLMSLEVTRMQQQFVDAIKLPKTEIEPFDGDPLKYHSFLRSFNISIGNSSLGEDEKLSRLIRSCTGSVKLAMKAFEMMEPKAGYNSALIELAERYGDPLLITDALEREIDALPFVKNNCVKSMRTYVDKVRVIYHSFVALEAVDDVDTRAKLRLLVAKLPEGYRSRWRRLSREVRRKTTKPPTLRYYIGFITELLAEVSDPQFSEESLGKVRSARGLMTSAEVYPQLPEVQEEEVRSVAQVMTVQQRGIQCVRCQSYDHDLLSCNQFLGMSEADRFKFIKEKYLCFNCLKDSTHRGANCPQASQCETAGCKMKHHKLIHGPAKEFIEVARRRKGRGVAEASVHVAIRERSVLCIVPLEMEGPNGVVRTNGILDIAADSCYFTQEMHQRLGLESEQLQVRLNQMVSKDMVDAQKCSVKVRSTYMDYEFEIPEIFAIQEFPQIRNRAARKSDVSQWPHLRDIEFSQYELDDVHVLIGNNVADVFFPLEVRHGKIGEPLAIRNVLGWVVHGSLGSGPVEQIETQVHCIQSDELLTKQVDRFWETDGPESYVSNKEMSIEDKKVKDLWDTSTDHKQGRYEAHIPFRSPDPEFPDNYDEVLRRLCQLKKLFIRNINWFMMYRCSMSALIDQGFVERVANLTRAQRAARQGKINYFAHFGTTQPFKPNKIRVVFDAAAEKDGMSLNKAIFPGPDQNNKLLSVLSLFRLEEFCVIGDIKGMFHMVSVPENERDYLRFLWWPDGDYTQEPQEYRWCRHPFGATHSPSVATYCLRKTAEDHYMEFDPVVIETVMKNFYVDDMLKSMEERHRIVKLVKDITQLLQLGGFQMTKWLSNDKQVLDSIPVEHRATPVADLGIEDELPIDRALGQRWNAERDELCFVVKVKNEPYTRRGILKVLSSIYDPIGFLCAFVLRAKIILQNECRRNVGWDEELEPQALKRWKKWESEFADLFDFAVPRCYIPGGTMSCQLVMHVFSDASESSYCSVCYIRAVRIDGAIHVAFVTAKNRLTPMKKRVTVPRLELCAAVQGVTLGTKMCGDFQIPAQMIRYWSDSQATLRFIKNTDRRFYTYVDNRRNIILDHSEPEQWSFIAGAENPSDHGTRGLKAKEITVDHEFIRGPEFLWRSEATWRPDVDVPDSVLDEDPEVRAEIRTEKEVLTVTQSENHTICDMVKRYSDWRRFLRGVAWLSVFIRWLRSKKQLRNVELTSEDVELAQKKVILYVQKIHFEQERLNVGQLHDKHPLFSLDLFLDEESFLRVGGRLTNAQIPFDTKHPFILPKDCGVTYLLMVYYHEVKSRHMGCEHVLAKVRKEFWPVGARVLIKRAIKRCVICKKLHGIMIQQKMADLPLCRVIERTTAFAECGCDVFGHFDVKVGRRTRSGQGEDKRWICMFTGQNVRGAHMEILKRMDSDAFIGALCKMESRRGRVVNMYSDRGSNFVGAEREMRESLEKLAKDKSVQNVMIEKGITWHFGVPTAHHMNGSWERMIRSARKVLYNMLKGVKLTDEKLEMLVCEVESILNSRPITRNPDSPNEPGALTPNDLMLIEHRELPRGKFSEADALRKRWKHAQMMADQFWERWRTQFLPTLSLRNKWHREQRNVKVGDICLLQDEQLHRSHWPLCRVMEVYPGKDGNVRRVRVKTQSGQYDRPVHGLCLLECDD